MRNTIFILLFILTAGIYTACRPAISPGKLYGKWHYIKVYKPEAFPPDSVSAMELEEMEPSIEFYKDNKLRILWGGKVLSQGSYTIDGSNIRFNDVFDDGTSREFPFYVSELSDKKIIFETLGKDGSRVTAVKR